jgi:anhydro-N-acetylmuramic acid kinase
MPAKTQYFLGIMSGTSLDAIDCALVEFDQKDNFKLVHHYSHPIPKSIRDDLFSLTYPHADEINLFAKMDVKLGELIALSCNETIKQADFKATKITAIGSHGQTIRHYPQGSFTTSLQIGDANIICEQTGICTIADFRRRDMAAGGQGAPLVPPFHAAAFQHKTISRCIVNIGGIANITCLPANSNNNHQIIGYDSGPGNGLMDLWCKKQLNCQYDNNGDYASAGNILKDLLKSMLADPYFSLDYPKSTGREYFGELWLEKELQTGIELDSSTLKINQQNKLDILTTLTELTAITIAKEIEYSIRNCSEVLLCGGGIHNKYLKQRLQHHLVNKEVKTTDQCGIASQWIESMAFAWLAMQTYRGLSGNLPSVTGAKHPVILGAIYQP